MIDPTGWNSAMIDPGAIANALRTASRSAKTLIKLLENLRSLGRDNRQFREFIEPTNKAMKNYHLSYLRMFNHAQAIVLREGERRYPSAQWRQEKNPEILNEVLRYIDQERGKNLNARSVFRVHIKAYLEAVDIPEFRDYIYVCGNYFIHQPREQHILPECRLRHRADETLEKGHDTWFTTPTGGFRQELSEIRDSATLGDLYDKIGEAVKHLQVKYSGIQTAYYRLISTRNAW